MVGGMMLACGHEFVGLPRCGRCNKCFNNCCGCRNVEYAPEELPSMRIKPRKNSGAKAQQRYNRWWLGKKCRMRFSTGPFLRVSEVKLIGPPSFVYGCVTLIYDDGTKQNVSCGDAFVPRKWDVEVLED